ncbi:MAG: aminotransferase class V-fold PLP-dependent enzyme [Treponema sp.]|nr:aminotransferase class V-fold PLP-dependent enzyme [Treponema sp.]
MQNNAYEQTTNKPDAISFSSSPTRLLHFESDYLEGAHPSILQQLVETNFEKTAGYGCDEYCERAKEKIKAACGCPDADVWFLCGGTQTNATVIDGLLRAYEGVIAVQTGHISVHEAGAIEATGHKVIALSQHDGKMRADDVQQYLAAFESDTTNAHMVQPGAVYISHPTEYGTLYTKSELAKLSSICRAHNLPLFLDGARLGYALAADSTDVTLKTITQLCDVFYIGGTKVGALFGEAVVVTKPKLLPHFFTLIKQHGALLAKGRVLGIQFDTLFTDNRYYTISRNAIETAMMLKREMQKKGYELFIDSPTNQQFFIVSNEKLQKLAARVCFSVWEKYDDTHTVIRLATSWATRTEDVAELLQLF